MTWNDIAKLFEHIELLLIKSFRRNLADHKSWESSEGFKWPAWQAEKLRNMRAYRKQNEMIMKTYTDQIDTETEKMLREQFDEGIDSVNIDYEYLTGDKPSVAVTERSFFGVNKQRLDNLIQDMQTLEKGHEGAALRMMDDTYRKTVHQAEIAMATDAVTLPKAVDMATKDFLARGINCIEYKDGRRVNIADYVQMALRTAATRSYMQGAAQRRKELGIDTVLVSQYGACSKTCLPWQGRVYIDDVWGDWHGERDGDSGLSSNGKWYPLLSVAVANGLFHPNCRHTVTTWIEGVSTLPKPLDAKQVRRNAKLEQQQRSLEREVRKAKRLFEGTQDSETRKQCKQELLMRQKELSDFINNHSDVLRRDYWREKTYGISDDKRIAAGDHPDGTTSKPQYLGKIDDMSEERVIRELRSHEADIINQDFESAIVITRSGEMYRVDGSTYSVNLSEISDDQIEGAYITHNHPADQTHYSFSASDMGVFISRKPAILRGVDQKYSYELKLENNTKRADPDTVKYEFERVYGKQVLEMALHGKIDMDTDEYHAICDLMAKDYKFQYRRFPHEL